jgi:uncharacterized membrane protein
VGAVAVSAVSGAVVGAVVGAAHRRDLFGAVFGAVVGTGYKKKAGRKVLDEYYNS